MTHSEEGARGNRGYGSSDRVTTSSPQPSTSANPEVLTSEDVTSRIISEVLSSENAANLIIDSVLMSQTWSV